MLATQRPDAEFLTGEMRDNFGARVSMGRLSPQGAMMMWENPTVGVSLPRAVTGRAMAACEDGRVVEVQCYRFPDLDAPEGSQERARLDALRPATSAHPRLLIAAVEAEDDLDTGESIEPTFREVAGARWVFADAHADIDPLATGDGELSTAEQRRMASSPMAILGLADHHGPLPAIPSAPTEVPSVLAGVTAQATSPAPDLVKGPAAPRLRVVTDPTPARHADVDGGDEGEDLPGAEVGYGPPHLLAVATLAPGDLIEVEPDSGAWAVVEDDPVDDAADPGRITVSWRAADDQAGAISLPDDECVTARTPLETT